MVLNGFRFSIVVLVDAEVVLAGKAISTGASWTNGTTSGTLWKLYLKTLINLFYMAISPGTEQLHDPKKIRS